MFAEQLRGNNQRKKWRAGDNPAGHPYCVTPSLGSKGHGRRRGETCECEDKLCIPSKIIVPYRLGQMSSGPPPWPLPEP